MALEHVLWLRFLLFFVFPSNTLLFLIILGPEVLENADPPHAQAEGRGQAATFRTFKTWKTCFFQLRALSCVFGLRSLLSARIERARELYFRVDVNLKNLVNERADPMKMVTLHALSSHISTK